LERSQLIGMDEQHLGDITDTLITLLTRFVQRRIDSTDPEELKNKRKEFLEKKRRELDEY
jgi:hypothetical protein